MTRSIALAVAMLLGAAVAGPANAQTAASCGPFRAEWARGDLSPTAEKLEGFVYNESSCSVTDVRIRIVAVSGDGHSIGETLGWVYGDIPAGARGYFVVPLPAAAAAAADYRVNVVSFDEISDGR
ncbi:MAG TPA: FxLYD domain-containing protein [Candidatus Binatia bacterium]|nr:FxLYD domain-containing protein [Candidatus Binatia bacterium]